MRQASEPSRDETHACWSGAVRAQRYDRAVNRGFYEGVLARVLEGVSRLAGRGLDLGCGTGFSTELLRARLPQVGWEGVDASAAMVEVAQRKPSLAGVPFTVASAEALPFPDATFDVVVANFSWHWFGEAAGREVRRVLRPEGWLLAAVPVRRASSATGNRALASCLLAGRERYAPRASRGLHLRDLPRLLPAPTRLARRELIVERESFADAAVMLDVLDSRGALAAIFGQHPPAAIARTGALELEWPYGVVHVQLER
jgi:SAM-dependent methyltransferase